MIIYDVTVPIELITVFIKNVRLLTSDTLS